MKEVAEQLLAAMQTALDKKKSGAAGNFQGILNNCRRIFETTIKLQAGRDPRLLALISQAMALQTEGSRTFPGKSRTATASASRAVNMAQAFEIQKKRALTKSGAVATKTEPPVKGLVPEPEPLTEAPDPELIRSLLETTPAKFRDRFGGVDGLKSFGKEMFGMGFEGEDDYAEIVRTIKAKLREIQGE